MKVRAADLSSIHVIFLTHRFRHSGHYAMLTNTLLLILPMAIRVLSLTTTIATAAAAEDSLIAITKLILVVIVVAVKPIITSFNTNKLIHQSLHFNRCLRIGSNNFNSSHSCSLVHQIQHNKSTSHGITLV